MQALPPRSRPKRSSRAVLRSDGIQLRPAYPLICLDLLWNWLKMSRAEEGEDRTTSMYQYRPALSAALALEAVISQRTCAHGLFMKIISYL